MKNHYYPKALIKQWSLDNTVFVHKHYIKSIYANRRLMERSSSKKELCMTNIYNQYTEKYTARYDQMFVEHIRLISKMLNEGKIDDTLKILTEQKMIEMYYNILCRQPSLNKQIIDSTITEIQNQPYLMCSKNNPFTVRAATCTAIPRWTFFSVGSVSRNILPTYLRDIRKVSTYVESLNLARTSTNIANRPFPCNLPDFNPLL